MRQPGGRAHLQKMAKTIKIGRHKTGKLRVSKAGRGTTLCDVAWGRCEKDLQLHAQRQEAIRAMLSARFAARRMKDDAFLAVLADEVSRLAYSPAKPHNYK